MNAPDYTWYVVASVALFSLIIWALVAFAVASG